MAQRQNSRGTISMARPGPWLLGCGVDVVEVERFQRAVERSGERFLRRIFTTAERRYAAQFRDGMTHLAARFAAKEAVVKAVSQVDPGRLLMLKQIEIRNDSSGRPYAVLRCCDSNTAGKLQVSVSLSHAKHVAVASAIAGTMRAGVGARAAGKDGKLRRVDRQ